MSTIRTSGQQITLQNLSPCSTYWVVVTAINCGLRIKSVPRHIELYESTPFNSTFCPGEKFICNDWINVDMTSKVADTENVLNSVLASRCLLSSPPCYRGSRFVCYMDSSMVTFE